MPQILLAALRKNATTAARLVEAGAGPTVANEDGVTALELATDSGDAALIAAMKKK